MIKRVGALLAVLLGLLVACGIPSSGQVANIQDKDLRQLGDTIPTTSTSTTPPTTIVPTTTTTVVDPATTVAQQEVALYFIIGGQLKGYPRSLAKPLTTNSVLSALQEGPPAGDPGVGIRSAIPTRVQAVIKSTEDGSGVATIELPPGFFEQTPPEDQLLAIGQIVLTVTEVGGIGQVLFVQSGSALPVPRGPGGGLSNGTEPLARRDYQELLNPPSATTTTTTTTTVAIETTVV